MIPGKISKITACCPRLLCFACTSYIFLSKMDRLLDCCMSFIIFKQVRYWKIDVAQHSFMCSVEDRIECSAMLDAALDTMLNTYLGGSWPIALPGYAIEGECTHCMMLSCVQPHLYLASEEGFLKIKLGHVNYLIIWSKLSPLVLSLLVVRCRSSGTLWYPNIQGDSK